MAQLLSARFVHALHLVTRLFHEQKRHMGDVPYTSHLFGVCHIVEQLTYDEDVQLAALLHDVLEDIDPAVYSAERLEADFGPRVRQIVQAVSHVPGGAARETALRQYLEQLRSGPLEACLVSGADMLHNGTDIIYWHGRDAETTMKIMGGERGERRGWFWRERYAIISSRLGADHKLVKDIRTMLSALARIDGNNYVQ